MCFAFLRIYMYSIDTQYHLTTMAIYSHRRLPIIGSPQGMTCFFYCVLLLMLYYMLAGRLQNVAEPYVRMPTSSSVCYHGLSHCITISLDAEHRVFLQADKELQTSLVQQVARQHSIYFTDAQLRSLDQTPYLSQNIQQLPKWLSAYERERRSFIAGITSDEGLSEYIIAGLHVSRQLYGKPVYFALRADESVSAFRVQRMIKLLQQHGINRFNFITEQE